MSRRYQLFFPLKLPEKQKISQVHFLRPACQKVQLCKGEGCYEKTKKTRQYVVGVLSADYVISNHRIGLGNHLSGCYLFADSTTVIILAEDVQITAVLSGRVAHNYTITLIPMVET